MVSFCLTSPCGSVAESLGSRTCNQQVAGSNPGRCAAECNPGQVVYTHVPLSPSSRILVTANGRWCSAAGEVDTGLEESNGSLPPGLWLQSPASWLPRIRISSGSLRSFGVWDYLYPAYFSRYNSRLGQVSQSSPKENLLGFWCVIFTGRSCRMSFLSFNQWSQSTDGTNSIN